MRVKRPSALGRQLRRLCLRAVLFLGIVGLAIGCERRGGQSITEERRQSLPPYVVQMLIQGGRAYEAGLFDWALAYTDSVEAYEPDLADVHFLRGKIYTRLARPDVAQAAYEAVLELDPRYPGVRHNMGLIAFRRGQLRDAISLYLAEKSGVGATAALHHELGRAYAKLGEPDSARIAYEHAIAFDSSYATSYMWLGQLHEELGDLERAVAWSLKGLALRPDDLDYQYIVGNQYLRLERPEDALPYLEPVARALPWHQGEQTNLGQAYMHLDREEEAQAYFVRADVAQQQAQAISEAEEAVTVDPDMLDNWLRLGSLLKESGQYDRAIEAYKNAAAKDMPVGTWLVLLNNLGVLHLQNGDAQRAKELFEMIVVNDPGFAAAWVGLGAALADEERFKEAQEAWEKALELDPENNDARANLEQLRRRSVEAE